QAAQDVRRRVLVAPVAGRPVLRLGNGDVGQAVEQPLDAYPSLRAREWRAGTRVDPVAEREALTRAHTVDDEGIGVLEAARVAIRGAVEHHQRRARGDLDTRQRARDARQAEVTLDRALVPQRFLDEVRDAIVLVAHRLLQFRALAHEDEGGREEANGRLLARREQVR